MYSQLETPTAGRDESVFQGRHPELTMVLDRALPFRLTSDRDDGTHRSLRTGNLQPPASNVQPHGRRFTRSCMLRLGYWRPSDSIGRARGSPVKQIETRGCSEANHCLESDSDDSAG